MREPCQLIHCGVVLSLLLLLNLAGCGADSHGQFPQEALGTAGQPAGLTGVRLAAIAPRRLEGASLDLAQAEIRLAAAPAGMDEGLFDVLRGALLQSLAGQPDRNPSALPSGPENLVDDLAITPDGNGAILSWTYRNVGDYDLNGEVNISDLTPLGQNFSAREGAPGWEQARVADGDGNGEVNISDVTPIGRHFFASVLGYNIYGRNQAGPYVKVDRVAISQGSGSPYHFSVQLISVEYDTYTIAPYDSTGEDFPQQPLANPWTEVLDPALTTIDSVSADGLVLLGETDGIQVGSIIVSAEGEGLLRRVEAVNPIPGGLELVTSQAGLEDAFDYLRLDYQLKITPDDVREFIPDVDEVEFELLPETGTSSVAREASDTVFGNWWESRITKEVNENLHLSGSFRMRQVLDFRVEIGTSWSDLGTITLIECSIEFEMQLEGEAKLFAAIKLAESKLKLGTLWLNPISIPAGLVPIIITPRIDLWLNFEAFAEAGVEGLITGHASARMVGEYTPEKGFGSYMHKTDFGFNDVPAQANVYGAIRGEFSLVGPEFGLYLYGVVGPYIHFQAPYVEIQAKATAGSNPYVSLQSWVGVRGKIGLEGGIFGTSFVSYEPENYGLQMRYLVLDLTNYYTQDTGVLKVGGILESHYGEQLVVDPDTGELSLDPSNDYYFREVPGVRVDFMQDGQLAATAYGNDFGRGAFEKILPVGTYDAVMTKDGYRDTIVGVPIVIEADKYLSYEDYWPVPWGIDSLPDAETVTIEITSPENGAVIDVPYARIEGRITYGDVEPADILMKDNIREDASGSQSRLYWRDAGTEYYSISHLIKPDGNFAFTRYLDPGENRIYMFCKLPASAGDLEYTHYIVNTLTAEHFTLVRNEQAAMKAELKWAADAVPPTSDVSQVPGVPNEDFRLVVLEPGSQLVAGQQDSGKGMIGRVPGWWDWYYFLPESQAVSGDTYIFKAHYLDSVWLSGSPADQDLYGSLYLYIDSETIPGFSTVSSNYNLRYPKAINPVNPFGSGLDWQEIPLIEIP
ncbi:MAG: hypothetical protein H7A35_03380 [Planctomycetales bacterium]|nr:hypothetical protein [bacterium]UNM09096.1 MAG: hypothetical protein H7A35_03380 [Planctomycetales bacterium]